MKKPFLTKKRVIVGSIALAAILLAGGGVYFAQTWSKITGNQMDLFNQTYSPAAVTSMPPATSTEKGQETTTAPGTATATATPVPAPTPTPDPYTSLLSQADPSIMKDTLNVLLIGVDYADERVNNPKQYVGKYFNSDVMLVLAINFKQNKVNMISVPRDSYARIANIDGIYKLNFALQAGGGMNDKGFMNVCKSVQGVLGGIPVNYYMAVTMPVMKELTDAIGGVDFDIDIAFTIDGREYKKGKQHMDGQAVLDYCRVRKGEISAQAGDLNRVNRQKKILLAVFNKLKNNSGILDVPKIVASMQGKVFTNMNFSQLASLAVFGSKLPEKNIAMLTMTGSYVSGIFNKNYVLINTEKRAELLNEVYGVTVPPLYRYTPTFARFLWSYMQGKSWVTAINNTIAKDNKLGSGKKLTDATQNAQLAESVTAMQSVLNKYKSKVSSSKPSVTYSQYEALDAQVQAMKTLAQAIFSNAGYNANWSVQIYKKGQMVMKE